MKNLWNVVFGFLKAHKKTVIIGLASFVGICLVVGICLLIPRGINSPHVLENTANELFFNSDKLMKTVEKLGKLGYRSEIDIIINGEDANRTSDLSFHADTVGYGSGENFKERMDYTIGVNENLHRGAIAIDNDNFYLVGYDKNDDYLSIYFPFDNIAEELEDSIFKPDSGSKYAMSEELYEQIKSAFEGDNEAEEELRAFIDKLLPKIKDAIKENTKVEGNTTTITLSEQVLKNLADILFDELKLDEKLKERMSLDDSTLDTLKEQIFNSLVNYNAELSYTVEKNILASAHLSIVHKTNSETKNIDYDIKITTSKNVDTLTFTATNETAPLYTPHNRVLDKYTIEYVKTTNMGDTNIAVKCTSDTLKSEAESFRFNFDYNLGNGKYVLEYYSKDDDENAEMIMNGKADYRLFGGYYFTIDKYVDNADDIEINNLLSCNVKVDRSAKSLKMPEGENFFDLTTERIDEIVTSLDFTKMDSSLWQGFGKKIHLSDDGFPIINYSVVLGNKEIVEQCFQEYLRRISGAKIKRIYYYDPSGMVYILCKFEYDKYSTRLYYFPGDLIDDYHEAKIVNGYFVIN